MHKEYIPFVRGKIFPLAWEKSLERYSPQLEKWALSKPSRNLRVYFWEWSWYTRRRGNWPAHKVRMRWIHSQYTASQQLVYRTVLLVAAAGCVCGAGARYQPIPLNIDFNIRKWKGLHKQCEANNEVGSIMSTQLPARAHSMTCER